jgi:hypothetical protein
MGMITGFATYGTTLTDVLNAWAELGVFAYVLPFLILFAIVFGILNKTKIIGDNKGVQATIALSVGLLSLQFDYVPNFFARIFPYAGIGLSIILIALILLGFATEEQKLAKAARWFLFIIGVVVFLFILFGSLSSVEFLEVTGFLTPLSWPILLAVIIMVAVIAFIVFGDRHQGGGAAPH